MLYRQALIDLSPEAAGYISMGSGSKTGTAA